MDWRWVSARTTLKNGVLVKRAGYTEKGRAGWYGFVLGSEDMESLSKQEGEHTIPRVAGY